MLRQIPGSENWLRAEPIEEGWSGEEKYHIFDKGGQELLLRVANADAAGPLRLGFDALGQLDGLPVPRPIRLDELQGKVCALCTYLPGEPLGQALPRLDQRRQYALGVQAGRVLRRIHELPAPENAPAWAVHFNAKIDRKIRRYHDCPLRYEGDEALLSCLGKTRSLLSDRPQSFQHGDYHVGNMLLAPDGNLQVIDFNRADYGDPWEEFNRIVWSAQASPHFASGQVYGYFNGSIPDEFWRLMALYVATNSLGSLPWALAFGEDEVQTMRAQARELLAWYDNFRAFVPSWYYAHRFSADRSALRCRILPLKSQKDYRFVVILSKYRGKYVLSRHRSRDTWETQGGHIEPSETPMDAARRELYEESGARASSLQPAFDYIGWDDFDASAGMVFRAEIESLEDLPESEMAEIGLFDRLPENLTYPGVTPALFAYLEEHF